MTERSAHHRPRLTAAQVDRARRLCEVHPRGVVASMLGIAPATLLAAERRGWKPAERILRPVPDDWGLVAPGKGLVELAAHYRASQSAIMRWRRERPVETPYNGGLTWQPPANFAALLEQHSAHAVALMLGVNEHTVMRARRRLGIHPDQIAARRSAGWAERYVAERRAAATIHHQ